MTDWRRPSPGDCPLALCDYCSPLFPGTDIWWQWPRRERGKRAHAQIHAYKHTHICRNQRKVWVQHVCKFMNTNRKLLQECILGAASGCWHLTEYADKNDNGRQNNSHNNLHMITHTQAWEEWGTEVIVTHTPSGVHAETHKIIHASQESKCSLRV